MKTGLPRRRISIRKKLRAVCFKLFLSGPFPLLKLWRTRKELLFICVKLIDKLGTTRELEKS